MSDTYTNLLEWSVIWTFFMTIIGFLFAEAFWLSKKGWTNFGRAFVFAALSNFISLVVSVVVLFMCLIAVIPLIFDDTASKNSQFNISAIVTIHIFAIFFTPVFLMICKLILLVVLKIKTGIAAWLYALVSSILIVIGSLGVPTLLGYFIYR